MKRAILPFLISKQVAVRSIMPKRRRGILHRNGAVLLNVKGNRKLQKWPNFPHASGNVWHMDTSSSPARLPRSTSAPKPN